ncbi:MAG: aminotransferase class I/II-fold pyridoxal phosphate-dependent enzyme [Planctomycetes bacterium]|nr:aminotransferase class I/II-fold pyridoxal phosphate-dependent enzyme [Planctomycetota bacterium]
MHDLRSDTVTRPTPEMRAAMAAAEVGDDVLGEDPTVRALEEQGAERLGKQAALFVPSGTMGNQICLGALTRPGDEIVAEAESHALYNEVGSAARLWGCQIRPVPGVRGAMPVEAVERALRGDDIHYPRTGLISIEQTHNYSGGSVVPLETVDALTALARRRGLPVHVDGARLFHAEVASGVPAARWVRDVELTSICLSKGLGAPVGSLVVGSAERIAVCRKLRKALGGGMRQAGVIAAAGLLALRDGTARLADDHARARALALELADLPGARIDPAAVQTNIVVLHVEREAHELQDAFARRGVLCLALDAGRLRFVLHRDVGDEAVHAVAAAARSELS